MSRTISRVLCLFVFVPLSYGIDDSVNQSTTARLWCISRVQVGSVRLGGVLKLWLSYGSRFQHQQYSYGWGRGVKAGWRKPRQLR